MMPQRNKRKERSPQTQPPSAKHDMDMPSSSPFVFPPGFRFVPTEEELILYYSKPLSRGNINSWPSLPVHHVNIYESNPQQLSEEYEKGNLNDWFFLSERNMMNKGGKRQKRGSNGGYWHATVAAKKINAGQGVVGYKSTLVYYVGVKTNWLMKEYWLESSHDNKTVGHALCKIYLGPMAKKKKKKEDGVEALEEEVEQPRNVEYQQPQPQFWPTPLDSHQPHPHDIASHQPQPLDVVEYQQQHQPHDIAYHKPQPVEYQQPQFWPAPLDSHQSQPHDIAYHQPHQPQLLDTIRYQQSHQPRFWQAPLDSHQSQPHDIAYHHPHQPQPLDTIGYQQSHQPHFWHAPLDSCQSQAHDIAYHQPQPFDTVKYQQPYQPQFWPDDFDDFLADYINGYRESNNSGLFEESVGET